MQALPSTFGVTPTTDGQNKRLRAGAGAVQTRIPATAPQAARPSTTTQGEDHPDDDEAVPRPDVFEYFAQRATRQKELQQEVDRLKLRETSLDRRMQDAELQVSQLKAELAASAARHEGREAQLLMKCEQVEASLMREMEHAAGLEVQLKHAKNDANGSAGAGPPSSSAAATAAAALGARQDAETTTTTRQLKLRVAELEMALSTATAEASSTSRHLTTELQAERQRCQTETAAAETLRRRAEDAEAQADAAGVARREAEERAAALEAEAMQNQAAAAGRNSTEGDATLIKSLTEQLRTAEAAAADAARLREQAAAAVSLRERLAAAESRARCAEQMLEGEAAAHAELASAQDQLQRWNAILSGISTTTTTTDSASGCCSSPEDVLHMMRKLQDGQVAAAAATGDVAEELATVRAEAAATQEAVREAEARAELAATRAEAAETTLARLERRTQMLTDERDSLKAVLASYDEEYLSKGDGGDLSPGQRRIAELEATVAALHSHIKILETEVGVGTVAAAGNVDAAAEAVERAAAAESRAKAAENEAEALAKEVALLQERVGSGEFNPDTTKVLHFRSNPEAELQRAAKESRVAELESENEALRQNLQRVEAVINGGGASVDGSPQQNHQQHLQGGLRVAQLEGEANLLRRRLAEAQKTSDRLQQVFTKQIAMFRDAIKGLFGYSVEMTSDPSAKEYRAQFILRPQHAAEAGAELAFRMLRDGRIAFVKTEYSTQRLSREVETFVKRYQSVPAFTANLTMENFQKNTQS